MQPMVIYYAHDILCGWCYGFSQNLFTARNRLPDLRWESLCGIMVPQAQAKPLHFISEYLLEAIPRLEETTGATIGEPFVAALKEGSRVQHSETSAHFMAWIKETHPELQFDAIRALQNGVFEKGLHPNESPLFESALKALGLDANQAWGSTPQTGMERDRQQLQEWGVQGYPTLVGSKNGQLYLLARGYLPEEALLDRMKTFVEKA